MITVTAKIGLLLSEIDKKRVHIAAGQLVLTEAFLVKEVTAEVHGQS